jgi:hypothetical protein
VGGPAARRYASSALLTVGTNDDLRYLWPRLVELSVRRWTEIEREILFSKPRRANWRQTWTAEEQAATEHFARAVTSELAREGAALGRPIGWDAVWDLGDDADRWVCAFGQCFEDVTGHLGPLTRARPATTLLALYEQQRPQIEDGRLGNVFWKGGATKPRQVVEWFQSPDVSVALSETWSEVGPDLAAG